MGSLIPFQDLNLLPDPGASPSTVAAGAITPTFVIPKIEPKLEQFDAPTPLLQSFSENPSPNFFASSTELPFLESDSNPNHTVFSPTPEGSPEENNVYSEYYRISELFRTAFSKRMENLGNNDASDPDSRAIVPVPEENRVSDVVVSRRRDQRSSELVRVTDLTIDDVRYFRDVVRRTRMVFDALRIFSMMDEEKRREVGVINRRARGDLRAAKLMKEQGLWLNRDKRIVGSIPGINIGDLFLFRMELCVLGLHGQAQAGIDYLPGSRSSNGEPIATSIIVSGGYEDDQDEGDVIIYTGHGGQDKFSRQCDHQKLEGGNLALERSMHYGIEVRVIRGIKYEGSVTGKVYVYDGLYTIHDSWFDVGKSGFGVYKYKLLRNEGQAEMGSAILKFAANLRSRPLTVRPVGYLCLDISMKKENVPVALFNDIDGDNEPMYYEYLKRTVFPQHAYNPGGNGSGCNCVAGCTDDCICALKNGGECAYDQSGFLLRGKPVIFECGSFCRCPPTCRNRVTQKGLRNRFEVFRSRETGWGVRSLDLIQAGAFICEYAGVVLTREQAELFSMNGDTLIYPNRFTDRWAEWGDLSKVFSDYVRPTYPSIPPLDFAMDVSRMRNLACYMSHSSCPNVLVQFVLHDHNNLLFPRLMLFAMENIPPLRELSLDYGVVDEWTGKLSICN